MRATTATRALVAGTFLVVVGTPLVRALGGDATEGTAVAVAGSFLELAAFAAYVRSGTRR